MKRKHSSTSKHEAIGTKKAMFYHNGHVFILKRGNFLSTQFGLRSQKYFLFKKSFLQQIRSSQEQIDSPVKVFLSKSNIRPSEHLTLIICKWWANNRFSHRVINTGLVPTLFGHHSIIDSIDMCLLPSENTIWSYPQHQDLPKSFIKS